MIIIPKPNRALDSNPGPPSGLSTSISTIDSFRGDHDDANSSTTDEEDWEHIGAAGLRALRDVRILPNASREITTGSSIEWKAIPFERGISARNDTILATLDLPLEPDHLNSDTFRALGGTDILDTVLAASSSILLPSIIEGESAKSDPALNSNSGSIASLLQWEQDRNIELIHHMQRVEKRLDDRAEELGRKKAFLGRPGLVSQRPQIRLWRVAYGGGGRGKSFRRKPGGIRRSMAKIAPRTIPIASCRKQGLCCSSWENPLI